MASEMLYPIMPIYLQHIGFSVVLIGVLEGLAEAVAGICKGYFGKQSDVMQRRVPFVQAGYALSAISKPLLAVSLQPIFIFFARTIDRLGKGIRTGARDAMLSAEATPETKGKVFGLHRSMDTLGAVIGPALALLYLYFYPEQYRTLFYLAFFPGLLAVGSTLLLKDKIPKLSSVPKVKNSFFSFLNYWKESPSAYRKLLIGLLIFAAINSSDVFLLLQAKQAGLSDVQVIAVYIFYNLIYALLALPLGNLSDKIGAKKVFCGGLLIFSLVYFGMATSPSLYFTLILFFLYGAYAAATEGVAKAWVSKIVKQENAGTALGTYSGLQSIAALFASSFTGAIWYFFGATVAFCFIAFVAIFAGVYLWQLSER